MKRLLLPLCLMLTFVACNRPARRAEVLLAAADSLSYVAPDSALRLIRSLDPDSLPSERLRARHALVHSMILDKCLIDLQDDSIIRPAVTYYAEHGTNRERMLAYYYWGRIANNAENYVEATERFLMSEHFLGKDTLDRYRALIASCIGNAYVLDYNFEPAIRKYWQAIHIFRALGEQVNVLRMYHFLGITYSMVQDYDGFQKLYLEALPLAEQMGDTVLIICLSNIKSLIEFFTGNGEPRTIIRFLYSGYNQYNHGVVISNDYILLALIYADLGMVDSVRFFLNKFDDLDVSLSLGKQTGILYVHQKLFQLMGDTASMMHVKDSIILMTDSLYRFRQENSVEPIEQRFKARMLEQSNRALRIRNRSLAFGGLALAALLTLVIVRLVKRSKRVVERKNAQIAAYLNQLEDHRAVQRNLLDRLDMQVAKEREVRELVESRFREIKELAATYYQHPKTLRLAEKIKELALSEEMLRDLESMVDLYHDGVVSRLRTAGGGLTEEDLRLAVLFIAGFTPQQISIVTNMSVNTIYVRKLRLRNKMMQLDPSLAESFIAKLFPTHDR